MKSKGKTILMVNHENFKKQNKCPNKHGSKGKDKKVVRPKPNTRALTPSEGITKENTCFNCGKIEH